MNKCYLGVDIGSISTKGVIIDNNYNDLLRVFANELIRITKDDTEPIQFITIVNNDIFSSRNGLRLDTTLCPIISDPINKNYYDYEI